MGRGRRNDHAECNLTAKPAAKVRFTIKEDDEISVIHDWGIETASIMANFNVDQHSPCPSDLTPKGREGYLFRASSSLTLDEYDCELANLKRRKGMESEVEVDLPLSIREDSTKGSKEIRFQEIPLRCFRCRIRCRCRSIAGGFSCNASFVLEFATRSCCSTTRFLFSPSNTCLPLRADIRRLWPAEKTEATEKIPRVKTQAKRNTPTEMDSPRKVKKPRTTTFMIRNIPNKYTRGMLRREMSQTGFAKTYDFLYLPIDFATGRNFGYAFINFWRVNVASMFVETFQYRPFLYERSSKVALVVPAKIQGKKANAGMFLNNSVMQQPELYHPQFYDKDGKVIYSHPVC